MSLAGLGLVVNSAGGFMTNNSLSKKMRIAAQPMMKFRQFCDVKDGVGKGRGALVFFDKVKNVTTAGSALNETVAITTGGFLMTQGTITMTEYGNGITYTGKLDALAEFDVANIVQKTLRNDMAKIIDAAAAAQFTSTKLKYTCLSATSGTLGTNGTASGTSTAVTGVLNDYHVKNIIDTLRELNVPLYDGENYICIGSVAALRSLKDSTNWLNAAQYGDPERLFSGEVGRYYNCRFIEETNAITTGNTMGASSVKAEAVFFGADAVAEAVAVPEEIRFNVATDFGRSQGIAWYYLGGFAKVWDYAADVEEHIIHVTSL